jgi:hypothetical protein
VSGEEKSGAIGANVRIGKRVLRTMASRVRGVTLRDTMLLISWIWREIILNVFIISLGG